MDKYEIAHLVLIGACVTEFVTLGMPRPGASEALFALLFASALIWATSAIRYRALWQNERAQRRADMRVQIDRAFAERRALAEEAFREMAANKARKSP